MAPRGKLTLSKDLCIYLVEVDEKGSISEEVIQLVRSCITDKIFAGNEDHIAICRSDAISNVVFMPANFDALRKVESTLRETRDSKDTRNTIQVILDVMNVLEAQGREDSYEHKKMLLFGHFGSVLQEDLVLKLANLVISTKIASSFIFPSTDDMTEIQKNNYETLYDLFEDKLYGNLVNVTMLSNARKQILNTLTKKQIRPLPWSVMMEIGPDLKIFVSGYVCTRKNTSAEMKKAVMKEVKITPPPTTSTSNQCQTVSTIPQQDQDSKLREGFQKTVVIEEAKKVTATETFWKEKDGTIVEESDIGKGFYYGDKLIPFNELENQDAYHSGEKCLKVLVFCPRSNIKPAYMTGNGTTLFYPKKGEGESEVKLAALIHAMNLNDRVAVVRKVYRKDTKPLVGILFPDMKRKCLVFSEICYADDVSVPHFPSLMKRVDKEEEGITEKEQLIDDLISALAIDDFNPKNGPIDPALSLLRANVASRVLDENSKPGKPKFYEDGIDICFKDLQNKVPSDLLAKLKENYPLVLKKEVGERPSGANIFRKRSHEEENQVKNEVDKKPKLQEDGMDQESGIGSSINDAEIDYDDLYDEL